MFGNRATHQHFGNGVILSNHTNHNGEVLFARETLDDDHLPTAEIDLVPLTELEPK